MLSPRHSTTARLALLALSVALGACHHPTHAPAGWVERGPAFPEQRDVHTIAALPAQCTEGKKDISLCEAAATLDDYVAIELERFGFDVVDARYLNLRARKRYERSITHTRAAGEPATAAATTVSVTSTRIEGPTWNEASPEERRALLEEARVDGVLDVTLQFREYGVFANAVMTISMQKRDGGIVWRSRCTQEIERTKLDAQHRFKELARCALEGPRLP